MSEFRKKPEFVEAEQWLGTEEQAERLLAEGVIIKSSARDGSVLLPTLLGNVTCLLNDYIVKDADGVYSVFNGDLFEANYELVEDETVNKVIVTDGPVEEIPVTDVPVVENKRTKK